MIRSHVCNMTCFIEFLGCAHGLCWTCTIECGCLLLECGCNEWFGWLTGCGFDGVCEDVGDRFIAVVRKVVLCRFFVLEFVIHGRLEGDFTGFVMTDFERAGNDPGKRAAEILNCLFAVDNKAQCWSLTTTGRESRSNAFPEEWANGEADKHVEKGAGLLCVHFIHVERSWICNRCLNCLVGNFGKYNSRSGCWVEF